MRQLTTKLKQCVQVLALSAASSICSHAWAQSGISDNVVKIGVMTDFSGNYADANGKGSLWAAQMAVEDFGANVLGKKVEVVFYDHLNKADLASSKAREWYDKDGVDMIVDLQNSAVALAVGKVAAEKNKVAIVVGAGSSRITNEDCNPYMVHYAYNTAVLANTAARAMVSQGYKNWYFLTADYAFGKSLEQDASNAIKSLGGEIKGASRHPLGASDFSSFMLQAKSSKAQVVGLANAGGDFVNSLKSAKEFGITPEQQVVGLLVTISEVHTLGLEQAQGLTMVDGWHWDTNQETRAFGKRFFQKIKRMPNMFQAGVYSATLSYLKAVKAAGNDNGEQVMKVLKQTPINDMFAKNGHIRRDGAMVHDMSLVQVKKPSESKYPWDYYHIKSTIKGDDAFLPLSSSRCTLN